MPTTIYPANHPPRAWQPTSQPATSPESLLHGSCTSEHTRCKTVIQSSFSHGDDLLPTTLPSTGRTIYPTSNALLTAVQAAYSQHHHLILRPEDIWFAILTQFSFYINGNAETLRKHFVSHAANTQKELTVISIGTVQTADFGALATHLTHEVNKNILDPTFREWIIPSFSTTTETDKVTAAVLMMGSMQRYFSYTAVLTCGIPSVTLQGDRGDWEDIRARVNKLWEFADMGLDTFARLLMPVMDYFVRSFDAPGDASVVDFWSKIADRRSGGSGPSFLSGWITAFCYWDVEGRALFDVPDHSVPDGDGEDDEEGLRSQQQVKGCVINGVRYGVVDTDQIPSGIVGVPLKVDDNGVTMEMRMVAGSVGIAASSSGDKLDCSQDHTRWVFNPFATKGGQKKLVKFEPRVDEDAATGLDTLECVTGWWLYELGKEEEKPKPRKFAFKF